MEKRKLIGVIISEIEGSYQTNLMHGIMTQAYSCNFDVAVFSTFTKNIGLKSYQIGETNIYNLINFDLLDGIIYKPLSIYADECSVDIEQRLRNECVVPIVSIDDFQKKFPSVYTDNTKVFEKIVSHLIEVHGHKNIYMLNGPANIKQSIKRENGYKLALKKHGLKYSCENVFYGDFWYRSGENLARDIADGTVQMPDAVACANDCMAVGLTNALIRLGINVPEQIAVTGYDGAAEGFYSPVPITTAISPVFDSGVAAVNNLYRMINNCEAPPPAVYDSALYLGNSCGCSITPHYLDKAERYTGTATSSITNLYENSYMTERLTETVDMEDFIKKLCFYTYLIKDRKEFYMCLCENNELNKDNEYLKNGYTKNMALRLSEIDGKCIVSKDTFETKLMLTKMFEERDYPTAYFFTPLHFDDRCLGYTVLNYGKLIKTPDKVFKNWIRNVNNTLEMSRVRSELMRANEQLFLNSIRDGLTGLYNRRGYIENLPHVVKDAVENNKKFLAIIVDVDMLKFTNDTFGHQEGDAAIRAVAFAITSSCQYDEICTRIGGDEFLIFGCSDYEDNVIESYKASIEKNISRYNKKSDKPFKISASIGGVVKYIDSDTNIEDIIKIADMLMYEDKTQKNLNRT